MKDHKALQLLLFVLGITGYVNGQCPTLSYPRNGRIYYFGERVNQNGYVATYICDPIYGLDGGDSVRTCDGTNWSGIAPTCSVIVCEDLPSSVNPSIEYVHDTISPYEFGTVAIQHCLEGYFLIGTTIRYCGGHGSSVHGNWDGIPKTCIEVTCENLPEIANGMITYSDPSEPHAFESMATYSCNIGTHSLVGGNPVRNCIKSGLGPGIWDGSAPVCEALICDRLHNPRNGYWHYSNNILIVGTLATLQCYPNHIIDGDIGVRECRSTPDNIDAEFFIVSLGICISCPGDYFCQIP